MSTKLVTSETIGKLTESGELLTKDFADNLYLKKEDLANLQSSAAEWKTVSGGTEFEAGTFYDLGTITELNYTLLDTGVGSEWRFCFDTGETAPTIVHPDAVDVGNFSPYESEHVEVSIQKSGAFKYLASKSWLKSLPKTDGVVNGVIQDSIRQVVINCKAGKASEYYSVGDRIKITLEGIGAFDFKFLGSGLDTRADGSDKPVSTWLCTGGTMATYWNTESNGTTGGWEASLIRKVCMQQIYGSLPTVIRDNIVKVNKTQYIYVNNTSASVTTNDKVWVPSSREISTSGMYGTIFPDANSRKLKDPSGNYCYWWLRDASGSNGATVVYASGTIISSDNVTYGGRYIVPGFCL